MDHYCHGYASACGYKAESRFSFLLVTIVKSLSANWKIHCPYLLAKKVLISI